MELFFTAAQVVGAHTGDPVGRHEEAHTACNSCKQEKAMMVMLGGEEMIEIFEYVGEVVKDYSYIKAMAKVEQAIKRPTPRPRARCAATWWRMGMHLSNLGLRWKTGTRWWTAGY